MPTPLFLTYNVVQYERLIILDQICHVERDKSVIRQRVSPIILSHISRVNYRVGRVKVGNFILTNIKVGRLYPISLYIYPSFTLTFATSLAIDWLWQCAGRRSTRTRRCRHVQYICTTHLTNYNGRSYIVILWRMSHVTW